MFTGLLQGPNIDLYTVLSCVLCRAGGVEVYNGDRRSRCPTPRKSAGPHSPAGECGGTLLHWPCGYFRGDEGGVNCVFGFVALWYVLDFFLNGGLDT